MTVQKGKEREGAKKCIISCPSSNFEDLMTFIVSILVGIAVDVAGRVILILPPFNPTPTSGFIKAHPVRTRVLG